MDAMETYWLICIIAIVVILVVVLVIMAVYARCIKHKPHQVFLPIDPNNPNFDHKIMEIRATADQVSDYMDEMALQGWLCVDSTMRPNGSFFGSHIWVMDFRKMTPEEVNNAKIHIAQKAGMPNITNGKKK